MTHVIWDSRTNFAIKYTARISYEISTSECPRVFIIIRVVGFSVVWRWDVTRFVGDDFLHETRNKCTYSHQ